jgi:hypothetical protein
MHSAIKRVKFKLYDKRAALVDLGPSSRDVPGRIGWHPSFRYYD